jgi:DNA-binding HxlR family transcriptional regulator
MQRKSFGNMPCPIARSLERVGEWWSILILRDALHGFTRFDQFQRSLGIAPNMLTARGRDFRPVIVALLAWGNTHFAPEGASVLLVNARTGLAAEPILVDRVTGRPLEEPDYVYAAGPAARERTRRKFAPAHPAPATMQRRPPSTQRTSRKRSTQ